MADEILDAAIVGGGVSGVYAGWRLATEGRLPRVEVFEASDRIGGRLLSVSPPGIRNMTAELGGMRILPERQPRIRTLIAALNKGAKPAGRPGVGQARPRAAGVNRGGARPWTFELTL